MPWFFLLIAGLFEVAFVLFLERASTRSDLAAAAAAVVSLLVSVGLLAAVMRDIPVHVAYPIWTGIGVAGATLGAAFLLNDKVSSYQLAAVVVIFGAVSYLHSTTGN